MDLLLERETLSYYNQDIIAKAGLLSLYSEKEKEPAELAKLKEQIQKQSPENIVLHNVLFSFVLNQERYQRLMQQLSQKNQDLAITGAKKIKAGSHIFVHSINNLVGEILSYAKKFKDFEISMISTGKEDLDAALIKKFNVNFCDLASLKHTVESADLVLLGGEALKKDSTVLVHKGSSLVAGLSSEVYVAVCSLRYDPKNQFNPVHTENLANIKAYITEHGIFKPEHVLKEICFYNKELFPH